jgi:hypothetical protein
VEHRDDGAGESDETNLHVGDSFGWLKRASFLPIDVPADQVYNLQAAPAALNTPTMVLAKATRRIFVRRPPFFFTERQ